MNNEVKLCKFQKHLESVLMLLLPIFSCSYQARQHTAACTAMSIVFVFRKKKNFKLPPQNGLLESQNILLKTLWMNASNCIPFLWQHLLFSFSNQSHFSNDRREKRPQSVPAEALLHAAPPLLRKHLNIYKVNQIRQWSC